MLGSVLTTDAEVLGLLLSLANDWMGDRYQLLTKNCNHFSQAFATRLGVQQRLPGWLVAPRHVRLDGRDPEERASASVGGGALGGGALKGAPPRTLSAGSGATSGAGGEAGSDAGIGKRMFAKG